MRYFRNSFIRYFAMGLAFSLLTFLLGLFNVKAWEPEVYIGDTAITVPPDAAFFDVTGTSSWSFVGNTWNNEYQNYGEQMTTNANSWGGSVCFSNLPFLKDYYYGIDVYFLSESSLTFPTNSEQRLTIGNGFNSTIGNYGSTTLRVHNWSSQKRYEKNHHCVAGTCYVYGAKGNVYSAVFKANVDSTSICVPFTTTANQTGYISLEGYVLTSLGASDDLIASAVSRVLSGSGVATASHVTSEANQTRQVVAEQNESTRQAIANEESQTRETITNDNTTGSESSLSGVINDPTFSDSSGVNAIINLPLEFINSLNSTCSPLVLNFPYFNNISIPCMSTIYHKFAPFDTILSLVINGIVVYRVLIELFYIVKSSRDPDSDRVEVLDL